MRLNLFQNSSHCHIARRLAPVLVVLLSLSFGVLQAAGLRHVTKVPGSAFAKTQAAVRIDSLPSVALIDEMAKQALDSFELPGFAIGIIHGDEVYFNRGYGVLEMGKPERVDEHTQFAIASNTKAFIGTAAALADHEGVFKLSDKVQPLLPYLDFSDPCITGLLTIEDLLSHRVGLGTFKGDHLWFKRDLSAAEVLGEVDALTLEYPFRAGYGYTNLMFIAAGEVLAQAYQQPWSAVVTQRLLQPLGMTRTVTSVADLSSNYASGHITRQDNRPIQPVAWEASGAAGGLWSSTTDMLKWMSTHLHDGKLNGDSIWPAGISQRTFTPENVFGSSRTFSSYGLGWFLSKRGGNTVISHGGGYDGMYSRVVLLPKHKLGIVVLTNGMTGLAGTLSNAIIDHLVNNETPYWLSNGMKRERRGHENWFTAQAEVDQRLAEAQNHPAVIEQIAGAYTDASFGTFEVRKTAEGAYSLHFPHAPLLQASLQPAGGDVYALAWNQPSAWFDKGLIQFGQEGEKTFFTLFIPNDDIFYDSIHAVREMN